MKLAVLLEREKERKLRVKLGLEGVGKGERTRHKRTHRLRKVLNEVSDGGWSDGREGVPPSEQAAKNWPRTSHGV